MIVVDTSVWVPYLHGYESEGTWLLEGLDTTEIIVGDIVLLEVLQGAQSDRDARVIEREIRQFKIASMLDHRLAVAAARNYRLLRERGATVRKVADLIVGTYCVLNGHQLLHNDRDFDWFETHLGLQVIR